LKKITVLIIDDSSVIRNIIKEALSHDDSIEVIGEAQDPIAARGLIKQLNPDVLTLDVEMPKMDGITFLENIMRLRPMPVIMLSTLTTKGADVTLEALEIGAVDFIAKPSVQELLASQNSFKEVLVSKIKQATIIDQKKYKLFKVLHDKKQNIPFTFVGVKCTNHLVAIGASTGGTEAITSILIRLPKNSPAIVITQHIPKSFSERFANRLNKCCEINVQEATHGQKIKQGNAYIAPGNMHLKVVKKGEGLFCTLEDSAEVSRHKPSVDVLFDSLIPIADNVQALLLTGMGRDGADGLLKLKQSGSRTLIQDKASSLVWGMPGKAYELNAHCEQVALSQIAQNILDFALLNEVNMKRANDGYV
jgi:two-component system chemotaxis response regulator CheB